MNRGRPGGGGNGDGPFWPVPMATSPAAYSRRSVVIREIRVIRGQPLLVKLDELPHQMLGTMMAMLKVLILGNEQSEATTDVPDSTDIYLGNASTGSRAEGIQGSAWLSPRLGSDEPLGRNDGGFDTHG